MPVFAKPGKANIKGEVTAVGDGTLTIVTKKGETVMVVVPDGFDLSAIQVGDTVMVKGNMQDDGSVLAESIKVFDKGGGKDQDDDNELEDVDEDEGEEGDNDELEDDKDDKKGKGSSKGNVKGVVTAVGDSTLTIETKKDGTMTVTAPADFDLSTVEVGDWVLVKGDRQDDGTITAERIKVVGKSGQKDLDDDDKPEGEKDNSAFCGEDKKDKSHPVAVKIAEAYGVTEEWVMGYFCDGYGMGAIMLALKTGEETGADPAALLAMRAEGKGWGQIWQELGLIGSEEEGESPPGPLDEEPEE
jgi:hypothetical protein